MKTNKKKQDAMQRLANLDLIKFGTIRPEILKQI